MWKICDILKPTSVFSETERDRERFVRNKPPRKAVVPKMWDILKPTFDFSLNFAALHIIIIFVRNKPSRKAGCADSLGRFKADFMFFSQFLCFSINMSVGGSCELCDGPGQQAMCSLMLPCVRRA